MLNVSFADRDPFETSAAAQKYVPLLTRPFVLSGSANLLKRQLDREPFVQGHLTGALRKPVLGQVEHPASGASATVRAFCPHPTRWR
jgi:hypothetical protein